VVVLRLGIGAPVEAFDGKGRSAQGRLSAVQGSGAVLELEPAVEQPERVWHGTLLQGAPKGDKKDEIVRAAVELGFQRVVLFAAAYTIGRPAPSDVQRWTARWHAAAISAAKQCGQNRLPEVIWGDDLARALAVCRDADVSLLCEAGARAKAWPDVRPRLLSGGLNRRVRVAVGPEGGWSAGEVEEMVGAGFEAVRLAAHILRVETAAIAAMALVAAELDAALPDISPLR